MKLLLKSVLLVIALAPVSVLASPPHSNGLPPGLQKKVERGESLPPGWQKKLDYRRGDRLDRDLYRYGHVYDIEGGRQRIEIEDKVYTVIKDTREIVDILNGRY
ncbi:MAG: hypothetical protein EP339_06510 [Gammaproteobacteria bacterium]|uniref:Uncharacterized protein n=1 Tax=Marinobacter nitratireducens TaxID=1137280 RepID=A0A072NJ02_9GAMM|nr:hypothetical protein [Marinobacter nitratireducens]KEF33100.1 hypothetical protein D777_00108 [Marinobacter nitratireducens]TNE77183.1 MAG: hypothetical protein EP339_06510 [Gammaproteobacteria bacterium]